MTARRPWKRAATWLAFLGPLFYATYGFANWWASTRAQVPTLVFGWERYVPFLPWTIFIYWSINAFYALSFFFARGRHTLDRHAARLLTAQLVAVSCFVLWPLRFSFGQPSVSGVSAFLFDALRGFDRPFNQAPSLHIALAVILWDWYRRLLTRRWALAVLHVWTLLVCASVLTTWQHHFIDIPTGALLGCLCVWLWPLERVVALPWAWRTTRDRGRWNLAGFYGVGALLCFGIALLANNAALWLCWPAVSLALVALIYAGLGARGFQMNRDARMFWAARWLFGPYRLGAALNARLWTRHLPASVEVSPGLRLGRLPTIAEWRAAGEPQLVSLCAELQSAVPGVRCVPMLDLAVPSASRLRRAITCVEEARATHLAADIVRQTDARTASLRIADRVVWVACALGFSRSAAAVVGWLRLNPAMPMSETAAQEAVRRARPQIVLRPAWHAVLNEATSNPKPRHG